MRVSDKETFLSQIGGQIGVHHWTGNFMKLLVKRESTLPDGPLGLLTLISSEFVAILYPW